MKAWIGMVLGVLTLASCSQALKSQSGLYDVKLVHTYKVAVDGVWSCGSGNPYAHKKNGKLYIAPLDISRVERRQPEYAPMLVDQMHDYMVECMGKSLAEANEANGTNWRIVAKPEESDARLDLAIVRLKTQKPGLRIVSQVAGIFSPVPGVATAIGEVAKGDICIEGTFRDSKDGSLLVAFKDSNRESVRIYKKDAFKRMGHADANLRHWAEGLATLVRYCAYDKLGDGSLRDKVRNRSFADAFKDHL